MNGRTPNGKSVHEWTLVLFNGGYWKTTCALVYGTKRIIPTADKITCKACLKAIARRKERLTEVRTAGGA